MKTIILDPGHGGIIDGVYQTPGKRSPVWADKTQLFEGEFNRSIVNRITEALASLGIPYVNVAPEDTDVSLVERVRRAYEYRNAVYISVHSNAGGGTGSEVYTSPGDTYSDYVATRFVQAFKDEFGDYPFRTDLTDGDPDKEARFYVLTKTRIPAILTENFFMDNETECKRFLMTRQGRDRIAKVHVETIKQIV